MLDNTDISTTWVEMRAMYGRGQHAAVEQLKDMEEHLPFPWLGLDSDKGRATSTDFLHAQSALSQ